MFVCSGCLTKNGQPLDGLDEMIMPRSYGPCEVCGNYAVCYEPLYEPRSGSMNEVPPMPQLIVQYGIDREAKEPVVVLQQDDQTITALSVAQARNFAADIIQACARAEADAMIHRFFDKSNFPEGAANALMMEFRHFRAGLDAELVERTMSEPTLDKPDRKQ